MPDARRKRRKRFAVVAPDDDEVAVQLEKLRRECEVVRDDLLLARTQLEDMAARLPRPSDPVLLAALPNSSLDFDDEEPATAKSK